MKKVEIALLEKSVPAVSTKIFNFFNLPKCGPLGPGPEGKKKIFPHVFEGFGERI